MAGYAVIDLETTGLSPAKHHRILEIGVVEVSESGQVEREWTSLVNPGRDIANSHVHGVTATDVATAPQRTGCLPWSATATDLTPPSRLRPSLPLDRCRLAPLEQPASCAATVALLPPWRSSPSMPSAPGPRPPRSRSGHPRP